MSIEQSLRDRMERLLEESESLSRGDEYGQAQSEDQCQRCSAWLVSAQNAVHLICDKPGTPYRDKCDSVVRTEHGWIINQAVGELASIIRSLIVDVDSGLLASVADQARAETFDDFLDHADAYAERDRKNEAGVIAGVVFEDSLRRLCRRTEIPEKGEKLDELISQLSKAGELSAIKAKRARAAAHVRTKASHAQWDEFEMTDVTAAVSFTRELIHEKLDR